MHRAVSKIAKQMRGLSDVSQKQAITELPAVWILAIYPENLDLALSLRTRCDIRSTSIYGKQKGRTTSLMVKPCAVATRDTCAGRKSTASIG